MDPEQPKQENEQVQIVPESIPEPTAVITKMNDEKIPFWMYLSLIASIVSAGTVGYLWYSNQKLLESISSNPPAEKIIKTTTSLPSFPEDPVDENDQKSSDSNNLDEIEKNLQDIDFQELDQELNQIEEEISLP